VRQLLPTPPDPTKTSLKFCIGVVFNCRDTGEVKRR